MNFLSGHSTAGRDTNPVSTVRAIVRVTVAALALKARTTMVRAFGDWCLLYQPCAK